MLSKEQLEELIKEHREHFPDWNDEDIEKYATMMANKYSTIKKGENIIHLDYFEGLITLEDIQEIETSLKKHNLELSRFDKNGVPYASLQDFTLHLCLILKESVVQSILLGIGTNALWDTIKNISFFIWKKIQLRHWNKINEPKNSKKLNFGLSIQLGKNKGLDLKLDGNMDEENFWNAIDKVLGLLESNQLNESSYDKSFYTFDKKNKKWIEVDKKAALLKEFQKQKQNKNKK